MLCAPHPTPRPLPRLMSHVLYLVTGTMCAQLRVNGIDVLCQAPLGFEHKCIAILHWTNKSSRTGWRRLPLELFHCGADFHNLFQCLTLLLCWCVCPSTNKHKRNILVLRTFLQCGHRHHSSYNLHNYVWVTHFPVNLNHNFTFSFLFLFFNK